MKTIVNYAQKVKEQHALNKTLAPVETDLADASRSYAIGEQFINDGNLFKAKTPIAQHDALVLDINYEAADDITTQIKNKTVTTDPVPTEGSTNPVQSNGVFVENRNIYEVMGKNGAKNLSKPINSTTYNGITVVCDSDGVLTVTGTASASGGRLNITGYTFTLKAGTYKVVQNSDDLTKYASIVCHRKSDNIALGYVLIESGTINNTNAQFTLAADTECFLGMNTYQGTDYGTGAGTKEYAMVVLADDTDTTYQPYAKTNQQLTAENEALTNKLNNEIVTRSALGAKNILPFDLAEIKALNTNGTWAGNVYTYRGVAFTVNSDGTISATGTATGGNASIKLFAASSNYEMLGKEVILTGCPSNGSASTYRIQAYRMASADGSTGTYFDDGAGTDAFTVLNDASGTVGSFAVAVYENATVTNLLFKPMVRLASDPDATYQPYAKTNQELTAENQTLTNQVDDISEEIADMNNVLGAKNLLPNNAVSQTINGVTFTANADGTVTVNGTATVDTYYEVQYQSFKLPNKSLILSGCPSGGSALTYNLHVRSAESDSSQWQYYIDYGDSTSFVADNNRVYVCNIGVMQGQTVSNLVFKPMLRPASIQDDTYAPYSMTNREMTPYVQAISNPNLLDNPWFTVNQRGQSSYNSTGYTVDRWYMGASAAGTKSVTVNSDETVTVANEAADSTVVYFFQRLDKAITDKLLNKMVTISVMLSDGTIFSASKAFAGVVFGNITVNGVALGGYRIWINSTTGVAELTVDVYAGKSISIKAIKLELGKVSTLAMDTAPNYAEELLKCQRYFINVFLHKQSYAGPFFAEGNANQLYFALNLPIPMRTTPRIELDSENIYVLGNNAHTTITTYTSGVTCLDNNVLKVFLGTLDATEITDVNDHLYALNFFDSNTKKFWLSADL